MITIGDLKKIISDLPDETLVIAPSSNLMEQRNFYVDDISIKVEKMNSNSKEATDAFDGEKYDFMVYKLDKLGKNCLVIN